jgi:immune inhibitor A
VNVRLFLWRTCACALALLSLGTGWAPNRAHSEPGTLELLEATPIPPRNPIALFARVHGTDPATIPTVVNTAPPTYQAGREDTFWIGNQQTGQYREAQATLRLVSPHAYWYVENSRTVEDSAIQHAADFFESRTYPTVHKYYGTEWSPGVDDDVHITVLMAQVPGVGAYFSSWDEYPRSVYVHSNEREMVDINLDALAPGTSEFDGVLAHEFQHMVHWFSNPNDETWVDEGSAELSTDLVLGTQPIGISSFAGQPDLQLTAWSDQPGESSAHYQAAFLFMRYFIDRIGGPEILAQLIAQRARGTDLFDRFLQATGREERFPELFGDWAVANFIDDPSVADGRYNEPSVNPRLRAGATLHPGDAPLDAQVHQFGADYIELQGDGSDAVVSLSASRDVRLAAADPTSGRMMWWSNRADGMDTTMTREFDLSSVSSASLHFKTWYEIEKNYDYLYVMASDDDGKTWQPLPGAGTSTENPTGNAVGPGYTGVSGGGTAPEWVDEQVDLSRFAGKTVLLRFEYVTDQAFNRSGALIDDVRIPEIGFSDDAEQDRGWTLDGFLRSDNRIPQSYQVRLIEFRGDGTQVVPVSVDADGKATARLSGLGGAITRAVLVVGGTAPRTLEPARYTVELTRG